MSVDDGRNINWKLIKNSDGSFSQQDAALGVLMDIRYELKKLNALLDCQNFKNIPRKLDRISANTFKRKPTAKPYRGKNGNKANVQV